ncbi:MAG: HK97 family phage prohead protease [Rhodospirillales bacterium]
MIRKNSIALAQSLGKGLFRIKASDGLPDDLYEIVVQSGIDLGPFRRNPVVFFNHQSQFPIGKASNIQLIDNATFMDVEVPEGITQIGDEVRRLYDAGLIKSWSIGFDPVEMEPMDPARPRGPQRYTKTILREVSACALPANPRAVTYDMKSGMVPLSRAERLAHAAALAPKHTPAATRNNPEVQARIDYAGAVEAARRGAGYLSPAERRQRAEQLRDRTGDYA